MQQTIQKLKTNFLVFLELQLLISLVILPILIAWGLPISSMSIVGNLLFAPFLTLFIFVSTLIFTTDLLDIPNAWIVQILAGITNIWHYCLSFGSANWLIAFPLWLFPISFIAAIAGCSLYILRNTTQIQRIICLVLLCCITPLIHQVFEENCVQVTLTQGLQKIHILKIKGKIYVFDCGALGARPSSQSWIEYTVSPTLIKEIGATSIDLLVLCHSNSRTEQAAQFLMAHIPTKKSIHVTK